MRAEQLHFGPELVGQIETRQDHQFAGKGRELVFGEPYWRVKVQEIDPDSLRLAHGEAALQLHQAVQVVP